jgi:transposase
MIQRGGDVVMRLLAHVQQVTITPLIHATMTPGTGVDPEEDDSYSRLAPWGYEPERVGHRDGDYARDDDGDGCCEMHVNTMEGFGSLLRSWLRPHRGISQEHLPLSVGFFAFVHHVRRRGQAFLGALLELVLT